MKVRGGLVVAVFFLVLGLYGLIQSLMFGPWESVALPAAISGVIAVMAAIEAGRELRRREVRVTASEQRTLTWNTEERRRLALVIGWVVAFMLGIYLFGFHIAIPVFAFSYLKWRGWHWAVAVLFAAAALAFVYGAFEIGLNAQLFEGIVFGDR